MDALVGAVSTWLWQHTVRHTGYICFKDNLAALTSEFGDLKALRDDVVWQAERARTQNHTVRNVVENWVSDVSCMEENVDELIENGYKELANTCLCGCCPKNCWSSYNLGKEIVYELKCVKDLKERGSFPHGVILEGPFDRAMRYLEDDRVGTIGIHGPAGGGKTVLLKEIENTLLLPPHHFVHVMRALVPQDLDTDKIQDDIGREVGFLEENWKGKNHRQRAEDLNRVLSQKPYVLLMDDLNDQVDLRDIGIPLPNKNNSSKVVFTTNSEVVCNKMGADEKIKVDGLAWSNGLALFQEKVGEETLRSDPEIPRLSEEVAKMCNGLPLALVTVGRAMTGKKTPREWHHSIDALQECIDEHSGTSHVHALLKFAFDNLPSDATKLCFLYCTLFPQDFSINKSRIIDCWIGEGFLGESENERADQRGKGYQIIDTLLDSCLLEGEGKDHVKMHEKVREVALWIARDCGTAQGRYLVEAGTKMTEAPEARKWQVARRISLMKNRIRNLTTVARCNDLSTLFLAHNELTIIPNSFFQSIPFARVLDLSENRTLTELPPEISVLSSLECLDLSNTGIRELPDELKKLKRLKCLNLEHTYNLLVIPFQLVLNFPDLNVLRMDHHSLVEGNVLQIKGFESLLRDLESLEHLQLLTISLKSAFHLQLLEASPKFHSCTQALSLYSFRVSQRLDISFLADTTMLEEFQLNECESLEDLTIETEFISRAAECFTSLRKVSISNCTNLKDLSWLALAPNLESLLVSRCSNVEKIISLDKPGYTKLRNVFAQLEVLQLVSLPKLLSIHPSPLPFPCIKQVVVDGCQNLRRLPLNSGSAGDHRLVIQGGQEWWDNLEWENQAARTKFAPSFKACLY